MQGNNGLVHELESDIIIMYGCLVPVCGGLPENFKFQCSGYCFCFFASSDFVVTINSTLGCNKIEL